MGRENVESKIRATLGHRLDRWQIEASLDRFGQWVVTLTHPASFGLSIDTVTFDEDEAITRATSVVAASSEIPIASAAPDLQHADLVFGLRTVASMFQWDGREVRAVAFLLFEHGHLNLEESAWLAGYEGIDAPMKEVSPLPPSDDG